MPRRGRGRGRHVLTREEKVAGGISSGMSRQAAIIDAGENKKLLWKNGKRYVKFAQRPYHGGLNICVIKKGKKSGVCAHSGVHKLRKAYITLNKYKRKRGLGSYSGKGKRIHRYDKGM